MPSRDGGKINYFSLYRFADYKDGWCIFIGTLAAMINGASQPAMSIILGNLLDSILQYGVCSPEDMMRGETFCVYEAARTRLNNDIKRSVVLLAIMGAVVLVSAYLQMSLWTLAGERQAMRLRIHYFRAVLRQDIAFFDKTPTGELTTRLTADILTVQTGISDKVGVLIQQFSAFVAGVAIAFSKSWKLALVLCSVFPILAAVGAIMAMAVTNLQGNGDDAYTAAGSIAQEALSSIRTVSALGGEKREIKRYTKKVEEAARTGRRTNFVSGAGLGMIMCCIFASYALGFWYGGTLIGNKPGDLTGGDVLNVFYSMIIGAFALGESSPNFTTLSHAIEAAKKVFETLDRRSTNDPSDPTGKQLPRVHGAVEFRRVGFSYPQRPDVAILSSFTLAVPAGKTVALVGSSGSGKSTIVKLLERFYSPSAGDILLDGEDIAGLNLAWLREQIGFVGQEPVLFDMTIRQNIVLGLAPRVVEALSKEELDRRVKQACVAANAWGFIEKLPRGLDSGVGDSGAMLSGGQKQRIAIARALIREPKILLLDEATSALDSTSEKLVQAALENAATSCTTIVIAHRLSTVKNADMIVVMDRGSIVETGTHGHLLAKNGSYAALVAAQQVEEASSGSETATATLQETSAADSDSNTESKPSSPTTTTSISIPEPKRALSKGEKSVMDGTKPLVRLDAAKSNALGTTQEKIEAIEMTTLLSPKDGNAYLYEKPAAPPVPPSDTPADVDVSQRKNIAIKRLLNQKKKDEEAATLKVKLPLRRLLALSAPDWPFLLAATFFGACNGVAFPSFSLIFTEFLNVFAKPDQGERDKGIRFWAFMFLALAGGAFWTYFLSMWLFGIASENLTLRLRVAVFRNLLKQDMAFFDDEKNSTGSLTARLATDTKLIYGLTGRCMGPIAQTTVTLLTGLLIAFSNGWQLTLIVMAAVPFIAIGGMLQMNAMSGFGSKAKEAYEDAADISTEAIDQIRTVATLGQEPRFLHTYTTALRVPHSYAVRGAWISAIGFGVSQGFIFFAYAIAFYAGSSLMQARTMTPKNVVTVIFAVIYTAVAAGQATSFLPNVVQAKLAGVSVLRMLDRKAPADFEMEEGERKGRGVPPGELALKEAVFRYPARPEVPVLTGLNIDAKPGETIAIVGPSGSGKSTVIALLERWYDVHSGSVKVSDVDVRDWRLSNLRAEMALVQQEPVLFNVSIRENIAYGSLDEEVSDDAIEAAAKLANIHDFVTSLPEGYNTVVGSKGGQLSGGQKQRVAIARGLIRNPRLLLLDEATSALDSESERLVQDALDAASKNRTTVVVAHRLSTVKGADRIFVVEAGRVVERGAFEELVAMGGKFAELVAAQSLGS
ncbi:tRNA N6-adenosine threonylcarbamoyltransferase [Phlyctochytrium bullatum]|nr:tRNA N6-adenosine threonylcarbamoyltransferase [Phlyctochytrium bullatum]